MAKFSVPYLTTRPGAGGGPPRYFWQPKTALQKLGWHARRIPDNHADIADPDALQAAAIAAAQGLNKDLKAWRQGKASGDTATAAPATFVPAQHCVAALIKLYLDSPDFKRKRPSTQRVYRQSLAILETWAGEFPVRAMTAPRFQKFYAAMQAETPAKANGFMRVSSIAFEYGRRQLGWIAVNPLDKPGLIGLDLSGEIWPRAAVTAFVAKADALGYHGVGTAVLLDEWLGQRQADILKLGRKLMQAGGHVTEQNKRGARIKLPLSTVPTLVARVEQELERQAKAGIASTRLIVNDETKQPYQTDTFRHHFAIVRRALAAEMPCFATDYIVGDKDPEAPDAFTLRTMDLQYMHLRHTAVTRLAESGCSVPQIAAITGHTKKSVEAMLERYLIRTGELARQAFARRLEAEAASAPPAKETADG